MSVTASAYALVGVRLDTSKLYRTVTRPGCNCLKAAEGAKFCPQCGNPAVEQDAEPIAGFDPDRGTFGILKVVRATYNENGPQTWFASLRFARARDDDDKHGIRCEVSDGFVEHSRTELKRILESFGLWDESMFGLWSVCVVSY